MSRGALKTGKRMRLGRQPGEVLDRSRQFVFTWNGEKYPAFGGDTIVSALAAAGERIFSRSFKYHRPRGLLTASFLDPGCNVQVGDEPNVRGAHRKVEPHMAASAQNAWPSLRFDVKSANRYLGRFLPPGFYYKTFMEPRRLWPFYEKVLQRFAGGGKASPDAPHGYYDKRYAHPDVVVGGGGPAGMAAAVAAAEAGARVMLVEEEHETGGHLRWGDEEDLAALGGLREEVARNSSIEVMTDSVVTGRYDDNWLSVAQRGLSHVEERLIKARAKVLVAAPGLIERPYVFEGNDLPGVILSTAARRLINLYAVKPGERAVVLTANAAGDATIGDLERVGVEVARIEDARNGGDIVRVRGGKGVREVECGDGARIECDLVVTATGWTAPTSLLNMAGDRPVYSPRAARFFPTELPEDGVLATGGLAGDGSLDELLVHARATGKEAARRAARIGAVLRAGILQAVDAEETPDDSPVPVPELPVHEHPELFRGRTHGIVDYSEDVSSKDLVAAVKEGYDSSELAKRYTTATMGPTQGKLETVNAVAVVAEATGRSMEKTGTTTWRPPYAPITLGALAGRNFEPVRHSPMQPWHERNGAEPLVAGTWIRPDHYGDPKAEVHNVRKNVGVIDVTPLGKLDLRGPDVPELLNLLYVNKWSDLKVGKVRYGVMCAEDGVILDDGVTGRLGPEHYLMTTTSSGAANVLEWIEDWLQTYRPDWRIHVTPVTDAYASINIAGPNSRELLSRIADGVDLSAESFPYMNVRTGIVAGVEGCFMWRIGFTGELSYEIHVPAAYGLYAWETLLERGADLGIKPFGVEAQRILRLEKGHFIVGQDTDALTQGFGAGISWAIKLDKEDFVGKPELMWQGERDGYFRLVGLQPHDGSVVPPGASQIVEGKTIAGRITSSRFSPTLGRSICLGFVAPHLTTPGTKVIVQLPDGERIPASVTPHHAHYDPEGTRQRG